ncbi:Ig-like domain-containing protein [Wukongibacter baidiensis]|uniref:Ig-like domain-containing protein n=1 Tax=Wukongibacter baidiensis TaxID=1723361 RepID=UPI003D7F4D6B
MKKTKRGYRVFLRVLLVIISSLIMFTISQALISNMDIDVKIDGITTANGSRGVKTNVSKIDFEWKEGTYTVNEDRSLDEITITAKNGEEEEESYKFEVTGTTSGIQLRPKTYTSDTGVSKLYQLQKHTLYTIHIPAGLLRSTSYTIREDVYGNIDIILEENEDIYFDFVTIGDGGLNDILVTSSPTNLQERIDRDDAIVYEFVDDVSLNALLEYNMDIYIKNYINITSQSLNASLTGYQSDSAENFTLSVDGNKLIIKRKDGEKLNDFSKYTVKLLDGAVYLKNAQSKNSIYNDSGVNSPGVTTEFKTNKTVAETSPENDATMVSLEPTIKIKFNYSLGTINTTTILNNMKLRAGGADGEEISLNTDNTRIYADYINKELVIEFNDRNIENSFLRPNAPYYLWINKGVISVNASQNIYITNEEININFTTVGASNSPGVVSYSSSSDLDDDIRKLDSTDLEDDGSIYIEFDSEITFDKAFKEDLDNNKYNPAIAINKYFYLYDVETTHVEHDYNQIYSNEIHIYNFKRVDLDGDSINETTYVHPEGTTDISELNDITKLKALQISAVEILEYENEEKVLKITPKYPLKNLNKYILKVDRDAIENKQGYNIESDIEFDFWTKKSWEELDGSWESVENHTISDIEKEDAYFEMPKYGEDLPADDDSDIVEKIGKQPIVIDVKGEIIPKATEGLFESLLSISTLNDYYAREKNSDGSYSDVSVEIDKIAMEYYIKNDIKYTKLYIYPKELKYGRRYRLEIPANVFGNRAGDSLPSLEFHFVVESLSTAEKGILRLDNSEKGVLDIHEETWEILVRGYNLNGEIDKVEIENIDSTELLEITTNDIEFQDVTTIKVKIRDDKKQEFIQKFTSISSQLQLKLTIRFKNGTVLVSDELLLNPKDKPPVEDNDTSDPDVWYDEKELNQRTIDGEDKHFLKITFKDLDLDGDGVGELEIRQATALDGSIEYLGLSRLMEESSLTAVGSSKSLIDTDFIRDVIAVLGDEDKSQSEKDEYLEYIFEKDSEKAEAYLYVPIELLSSQTTYNVTIASNVVVYSGGGDGNDSITWSFTTMADPVITDMLVGSVGEDYDEDEPLIITGQFFYKTVKVYFNDIEAEDVDIEEDDDGTIYLEVYLPDGNDRLEPGIYNIFIENDDNHRRELYGVFSVVKEGDKIPTEEYVSTDVSVGEVRAEIKVSENTVLLKSKYADDNEVELDLDELMGNNVLVRKIVVEGDEDDEIDELITKSRWANIDLYEVSLEDDSDDDELTITLGRIEDTFSQSLKKKLKGKVLKSEFIRVSIENCTIDKVVLEIPFERANPKKLKVLRYDEETRNFYIEQMSIDLVDRVVTVESKAAGIFIVVED